MSLLELPLDESRERVGEIENALREILAAHGGGMSVSELKAMAKKETGCSDDEVLFALSRLEPDLTNAGTVKLLA